MKRSKHIATIKQDWRIGQIVKYAIMFDVYNFKIIDFDKASGKIKLGWTNESPGSFYIKPEEIIN